MSTSTYLGNQVLDSIFNNDSFAVTTVYVSLHTGDPGTTGASESTGGAGPYARQAGSWTAAASKSVSNDTAINFTGMPASTVTHAGLWDAVSGGNFLAGGALTVSRTLAAGATGQFAIGALVVNFT